MFNANPVKNTVSSTLLEIGKRLSGPKEMVKLLRLCIDFGEEKVIAAADHCMMTDQLSLEQIKAFLHPVSSTVPVYRSDEIKVKHTGLAQYDKLLKEDVAI